MKIKSLKLENFRNYDNLYAEFDVNNNIIHGLNAQGKTNLIEAIYFISTLKSFRTSKNRELIQFNKNNFNINCVFDLKNKEYTIKIAFFDTNKYKITINGVEYKSKSQILGIIKTVVFAPDDLYIVKESSIVRRNFLNENIIQFRPKYDKLIKTYNKYLKEKNYILKNLDKKPNLEDLIIDYNEQIAKLSAEISFMRANFLNLLEKEVKIIYSEICGNVEEFSMDYETKLSNPSKSYQKNVEEYQNLLKIYYEKEKMAKNCLVGCHKDDILFYINNKLARDFASQGQIRSIVLSLKLAIRELHFKDCSIYPILILDDILSELDANRKKYITNKIKNGQVLITTPFLEDINFDGKIFHIENGNIKE